MPLSLVSPLQRLSQLDEEIERKLSMEREPSLYLAKGKERDLDRHIGSLAVEDGKIYLPKTSLMPKTAGQRSTSIPVSITATLGRVSYEHQYPMAKMSLAEISTDRVYFSASPHNVQKSGVPTADEECCV